MNSVEFVQEQQKVRIFKILGFGKIGPRINRMEFLGLSLSYHVLSFLLIFCIVLEYLNLYFGLVLLLFPIIKSWAVAVRRIHDFNYSGWWLLLFAVPYIGPLVFFALFLFCPGTKAANRFGSQPTPTTKRYWTIFAAPAVFLIVGLTAKFI